MATIFPVINVKTFLPVIVVVILQINTVEQNIHVAFKAACETLHQNQ